jgi:3-methyladenine DNA glycosylase AlkD
MNSFILPLALELSQLKDLEKAALMKAYMKDNFEFLGIQTPERRKVCKHYMKQHAVENEKELETIVKELWALPEREFQYFAIELMAFNKKLWVLSTIEVFEFCIIQKSWWDTVDFIATECLGRYFKIFPEQIEVVTKPWNLSLNIWLQRSSLLFQKSYKKDTDTLLLSEYIVHLAPSKEFFIQKAIGWVLREYAKTNAAWVKDFVEQNKLAPLSKREALKHI